MCRDLLETKKRPRGSGTANGIQLLATETAQLAENLPDGAAIEIAAGAAIEEEHLADLLFRICVCLARTGMIVTDL